VFELPPTSLSPITDYRELYPVTLRKKSPHVVSKQGIDRL
jgi:hypothetical protein